nr:PREDICTED: uncharacterized protein LOC108221433 [Daucus carota subsp. sativus]
MAQHWYSRLPPNYISCFDNLSKAFIGQFVGSKTHAKSSASLMNLHQGRNESLREYMNRFTKEALKVLNLDQKVAMIALQQGTIDDNFRRSLAQRAPDNMNDLQERAGKYIKVEESLRKSQNNQGPNTNFKKRGSDAEYNAENKYSKKNDGEKSPAKKKLGPRFTEYARLNAPRSQILMEIKKDESNNDDKRTQPRGPVINVISGGPTAAGTSSSSRKAYAREVMSIVGEPPKQAKIDYAMAFDNVDLENVKFPHDDPLVITPVIRNSSVKRVLVDSGASVDILFYDAYEKMGYADSRLTPSDMPIYGFNNAETKIEEDLDVREEEEERKGKPAEDLVPIPLYTEEPEKVTYVGTLLQEELKQELVRFLRNNRDVFAWTAADMPGIDPPFMTHKLNVNPERKPIKQKKRNFAPERQDSIK